MKIQLSTIKNGNKIIAMKKVLKTNPPDNMPDNNEKEALPGYQFYPESEDIYNKFKEEKNMDPEDISKVKNPDKSDNSRGKYWKSIQ